MLTTVLALAPSFLPVSPAAGQETEPAAVYHVHFVKAAPGKTEDLVDRLRSQPTADSGRTPDEVILLQHLEGDDWDYLLIEHQGKSAVVEASLPSGLGQDQIQRARASQEWHADTFVAGPPLAEFKKALGIPAKGEAAENAVYIVGQYRSVPGHRDDLEKTLEGIAASSKDPAANVLLQHLEGGAWEFLSIRRYESWAALAAEMTDSESEARQRASGFTRPPGRVLRDHMGSHHDTITARVLTRAQEAPQER